MSEAIPVAVLGATGYAGEGTVKILLGHPGFDLVHVGSDRLAGTALGEAVPELTGVCDLELQADTPEQLRKSGAKAVVLAKKSPEVTAVVPELLKAGMRLVDIGAEFRLRDHADYQHWHGSAHACPELLPDAVYGLSEWHRAAIADAEVVGNPGCYATTMLLPTLPLVQAGLLDLSAPLVCVGYSGISGAGKRFIEKNNNLFWATNENLHSYKAVGHQHTGEVDQELSLAAGGTVHLSFVPHLAPLTRGIHNTITARLADGVDREQVYTAWNSAYGYKPFIRLRKSCKEVEVANVTATNFADFAAEIDGDTLIITSTTDNLIKGASGQAVQNLNIMYGYDEGMGLMARSL
jgi:N-acetyl-gamma-glutamyl-phosphate reductase